MPDHVLNSGGGLGALRDLLRSGGVRRGRGDRFDAGDTQLTAAAGQRASCDIGISRAINVVNSCSGARFAGASRR